MMKKRGLKKQFAINAGTGVASQIVTLGVGLFTIPYLIYSLGPELYGISQLVTSALAFFGFLRLGMGPTLIRFCSKAIANKDRHEILRVSSNSFLILGALGILGAVAALSLIPSFIEFYKIPTNLRTETVGMMTCLAISIFLNLLLLTPTGLLLGSNRFELTNGIEITCTLLRITLIVAVFELFRPSIFFLGLIFLGVQCLRLLWLFTFTILIFGKSGVFSLKYTNKKTILELVGFSFLTFLNTLSEYGIAQGPILIIGKMLGLEYVAFFSPAFLITTTMTSLAYRISSPLIPVASRIANSDCPNRTGYWSMMIGVTMVCVGLLQALPLSLFGKEITTWWLGASIAEYWTIFAIAAFGAAISSAAGANGAIALGSGSILPAVFSKLTQAVTIPILIAAGVSFGDWGLLEIAIAIAIADISRAAIYLTFAYAKQFHYSPIQYLVIVFLRPTLLFLCLVVVGLALKSFFPDNENNPLIIGSTAIATIFLHGILTWIILLPNNLKELITNQLKKLRMVRQSLG